MPNPQKGFSLIIVIIGILTLISLIYVGNLILRYNEDVKLQKQKDEGYQQYLQSSPSVSPNQTTQYVTKEQAIECVKKEAAKNYPNKNFTVVVTDENEAGWFTSVLENGDPEKLMGQFPVSKSNCQTHFAAP